MLDAIPHEEPIAVTLVERPLPPPACIHETIELTVAQRVAVVRCCDCPYGCVTHVTELA